MIFKPERKSGHYRLFSSPSSNRPQIAQKFQTSELFQGYLEITDPKKLSPTRGANWGYFGWGPLKKCLFSPSLSM